MSANGPVLIVNDYAPGAATLRLVLESRGYTVVAASSARSAAALLRQGLRPTAVITNLDLEFNGAGLRVARAVRHYVPRAGVMVIGSLGQYDTESNRINGIDYFLLKPVNPHRLINKLDEVVRAPLRRGGATSRNCLRG